MFQSCPSCGQQMLPGCFQCEDCQEKLKLVITQAFDERHRQFESTPAVLTEQLMETTDDAELPDLLYRISIRQHELANWPSDRQFVDEMPLAVQMAYRLMCLEGEVENGGFAQWLTNSSGEHTHTTLCDLKTIGAAPYIELVTRVLELNREIEARFPAYRDRFQQETACEAECDTQLDEYWQIFEESYHPKFDDMSTEFYELCENERYWDRFVRFLREQSFGVISMPPVSRECFE